jgi:hypothetical protein
MKKLFILIISLVLPLIAIAGPEDYTPGAVYISTSPAPYYLSSFTFDSAKISVDSNVLVLEARYGNLIGNFKIISTSRHNEDRVSFTAKKTIINKWESGCGNGEIATVTIKGEENISSGVDVRGLEISVEYTTANDTCHSRAESQVLNYKLAE